MNNNGFKMPEIPNIAKGTAIPESIELLQLEKEQQEYERKREFRHDWLIASFSIVTGTISGLLGSLIFWLIAK